MAGKVVCLSFAENLKTIFTMEKRILFRCLYLLVGLLLLVNTSQLVAASFGDKDGEPVGTSGNWAEGNRSFSDSIPVQLYWDGTNLYIENPSGRSEIHVSISNGFEAVLPEGTTSAVVYVGAIEGPCVVVLTNQFGDRVEGILE